MTDYIIDTNVLLVASAQHPGSPFKGSNAPPEQMQAVLNWLMAFRKNGRLKVVLDPYLKHGIWEEYHRKMTGQDIGLMVVMEKLQFARFVDIEFDGNGHACLPHDLEKVIHDPADRKFVAVAWTDLSEGEESSIINAVDTDWCVWEKALKRAGITVTHLIEGLCERTRQKRAAR